MEEKHVFTSNSRREQIIKFLKELKEIIIPKIRIKNPTKKPEDISTKKIQTEIYPQRSGTYSKEVRYKNINIRHPRESTEKAVTYFLILGILLFLGLGIVLSLQNKVVPIKSNISVFSITMSPVSYPSSNPTSNPSVTPTNKVFPSVTGEKYITPTINLKCPENGWVDCSPKAGKNDSEICSKIAQEWYEVNCPNFKSITY